MQKLLKKIEIFPAPCYKTPPNNNKKKKKKKNRIGDQK